MLKDFIKEVKKATSSTYLKVALVAVLFIPLFYGALYLRAFWDPYGKMDQTPIAVVNLDKGYSKDGTKINIGDELIATLKDDDHLKWKFVSANEAQKGLDDKKYYTSLTIPADFSQKIYSIDGNKPEVATVIYKSREATNYLATNITSNISDKIIEALSHKITAKYLNNIFSGLKSTATDLTKAKDASAQLETGLNTIANGTTSVQTGLASAANGNKQLIAGLDALYLNQNKLTSGLASAVDGTNQLKTGTENVSSGLTKGQAALNAYIAMTPTATDNPYIKGLQTALSSSIDGQAQITSGLTTLSTQLDMAKNGSNDLASGTTKLSAGANDLNSGLTKLSDGTNSLSSGVSQAKDGATQLNTKLAQGAEEATASSDDKKTSSQTKIMANPVSITTESYDKVATYGSGFAPYFISLALWVGSLMSFFVIDFTKKPANKKIAMFKYIILAVLGTAQAIILGLVLQHWLGLKILNQAQFYGFVILMSLTFMSINQLLIQHLDNIGRYIAIVLLILQLTSAAGTFPKETLPAFFQIINPFLPMTYSISALRDILFTNELSNLWMPIICFVVILIVCILTNFVLTKNLDKER